MAFVIFMLMAALFNTTESKNPQDPYLRQREEMVRLQLKYRGISDPKILEAFSKVPRDAFVPAEYRRYSYADQPIPIGEGQTISQPYIVAYMTEMLQVRPNEKVLEIGTGSGYQAAILAELDVEVFSIEVNEILADRARTTLENLGYKKINLKTGDGYEGWEEHAPFDAILVTCSPASVPPKLREQLAEGGRMIIPVGMQNSVQYLYLLDKQKGIIRQKNVMPVRFVPMTDGKGKTY